MHLINIGTYCVLGSATCASRPEGPPDILISQSHVFCKHIVIHNDLKHCSSISPHMPPAPPPYLLPVRFETVLGIVKKRKKRKRKNQRWYVENKQLVFGSRNRRKPTTRIT